MSFSILPAIHPTEVLVRHGSDAATPLLSMLRNVRSDRACIPVAVQGRVVAVSSIGRSLKPLVSPGSLMLSTDTDILRTAEAWKREGRGVAVATVVETWGSAPRPVGSHLVIDGETNFLGSVSGGCVEGAVITEALDVIADGKPRMLEFGVADETAWQVGLSCGGRIRVYVERVD
jgi:hypothetical protein